MATLSEATAPRDYSKLRLIDPSVSAPSPTPPVSEDPGSFSRGAFFTCPLHVVPAPDDQRYFYEKSIPQYRVFFPTLFGNPN